MSDAAAMDELWQIVAEQMAREHAIVVSRPADFPETKHATRATWKQCDLCMTRFGEYGDRVKARAMRAR